MSADPYRYFRIEGRELLDQLTQAAFEFDKGGAHAAIVARVLRIAHTLKGAARVVKQREIADSAHAIEDLLAAYRDAAGPALSPQEIDLVLRHTSGIRTSLDHLDPAASRADPAVPPVSELPQIAFSATTDDMDRLLAAIGTATTELASLRAANDAVNAARFDSLTRELGAAREAAERLRLVPAGLMFVALEALARDAAHALEKQIDFEAHGGEVRLEAEVYGSVQHALVQAVRNAVTHGIESTAERVAKGKPARGRIVVTVTQRDRDAIFSCRDDGRGVDVEAVRAALIAKGMSPGVAGSLDADAVIEQLLSSGVSTAAKVTQHAGRGIGLDVIRDAVARLRGRLQIESKPQIGATLSLTVPVLVSAVRALIVAAGTTAVGIPLAAVRRALRVLPGEFVHSSTGPSIRFEGKILPFVPLERALRQPEIEDLGPRVWSTVVVASGESLAALGVAALRGTEHVMLRPLPPYTPCDRLIAGASFTADGRPQLMLDPAELVTYACSAAAPAAPAARAAPRVLIIDDSLTTRMLEQSILESAGYDTDVAVSAEAGLECAKARRYALMLVDVDMPGMDGFTFIETIRADVALKDIPAILVTSRAAPEDLERGRRVGAQGYIVKGDFDQGKLLDRIRTLVGGG